MSMALDGLSNSTEAQLVNHMPHGITHENDKKPVNSGQSRVKSGIL